MKTVQINLLAILIATTGLSQQFDHVPPCGGSAHSTSVCWGYATGRAFGKNLWNNDPGNCDLRDLYFLNVDTTYFTLSYNTALQAGTILAFLETSPGSRVFNHVAYVNESLLLDQVNNEGAPEVRNLTLSEVVHGNPSKGVTARGNPVARYVPKALWNATIKNQLADGSNGGTLRLVISGQESRPNSPYSLRNRFWGETLTIDAEMNGVEINSLIQLFQQWTGPSQAIGAPNNQQSPLGINWKLGQTPEIKALFRGKLVVSATKVIPSGTTVTIDQTTIIDIQANSELVVYGRLVVNGTPSQRVIFASPPGTTWKGIRFEGSGANNSSLQYCDIQYALSPIVIKNGASNITISNCTIGNSRFDGVSPDWAAAAIAVYGSSASITNTTISGNGVWGSGGSQNGIRFAQGSAGGVSGCTIQNLGLGNGIVVQGGSDPTITGNIEKSPGVTRAAFLFSAR